MRFQTARALFFGVILLLVIFWVFVFWHAREGSSNSPRFSQPQASCNVIHEPPSGCPRGYVKEKRPRFTERDGEKVFACLADEPGHEDCTDVLNPGESEEIGVIVHHVVRPESPKI